jgi:hypothetical protein
MPANVIDSLRMVLNQVRGSVFLNAIENACSVLDCKVRQQFKLICSYSVLVDFNLDKIKVYVCSLKDISMENFVDRKSLGHPCARATDKELFAGLRKLQAGSFNGVLSQREVEILDLVEQVSAKHGLEYEIVDLADCGFRAKFKFLIKGVKVPAIAFKDRILQGIFTEEDLEQMLQE